MRDRDILFEIILIDGCCSDLTFLHCSKCPMYSYCAHNRSATAEERVHFAMLKQLRMFNDEVGV